MSKTEFVADLAEILEVEPSEVTDNFELNDSNWTSLAFISTIALIDEHYDKTVSGEKLASCKTVADLMALIEAS